jgi:penicillin-binding protein 1A
MPLSDLPARAARHLQPLLARLRRPTRRGVVLAVAAVPASLLLYSLILIPFTPGISDIRKARLEQPARVLSADGKELAVFKWANREWVGLAQMAPSVKAALIATEDHRFYEHHGIDFYRLGGAALRTFSGERQGGSTLTQQLARNLYPDEIGRAPTLTRKLKEAITALKIEAVYSKDEILETYLNTVPFLYNAWGIEMAARTYFDKPARSLDVLESATLVGMLKGNSYYNPVQNPERALARRNTVLAQMARAASSTRRAWRCRRSRCASTSSASSKPRPGAALCPAGAPLADRLGRPPRLQHLHRRPGAAHHPRQPPAGPGHPGRGAPRQAAAGPRRRGLAHGLGRQPGAGGGLHPRIEALPRRRRQRPEPDEALKQLAADKAFIDALARQDPGAGGLHGRRPAHGPGARLGRQPRLRAGPLRPRAAGPPPAGLHLQALRVWRRLPRA